MGLTGCPSGSCRPQMGAMLAHESCCTKIHASVIHFLIMRGILPIDHINTSRPRQNQCRVIPAPMTSGVCILGICFLGVAFRGIPTPMLFLGLYFVYLHSRVAFRRMQHRSLLGIEFWLFAFWGFRFGESQHRCLLGIAFWVFCILGVAFRGSPTSMPSGGCILGICILGVLVLGMPPGGCIMCILGVTFRGILHSGGCVSGKIYIVSCNGKKYGNQMILRHFFKNQHHISPNHGKYPSESSGTWLMHLCESCIPPNSVIFTIYTPHCSSSHHMLIKCQLK